MSAKVEDGLMRVLESSAAASEFIDVVVSFDVPGLASALPAGKVAAPKASFSTASLINERQARSAVVAQHMQTALKMAGELAGEQPEVLSQQTSLGTALVKAHPSYFKALLDQPSVKGAMLNSVGGSSSSSGRVSGR